MTVSHVCQQAMFQSSKRIEKGAKLVDFFRLQIGVVADVESEEVDVVKEMEDGRSRRKWRGGLWLEGRHAFLAWKPVCFKVAVCGPDQSTWNVGGHLHDAGISERCGKIAILNDCAEHFGGAGREPERKAQQTWSRCKFHQHLRPVRNIREKVERFAENRFASIPRGGQTLGAIYRPPVPLVFPVEHRHKHSSIRDHRAGNHGFFLVPYPSRCAGLVERSEGPSREPMISPSRSNPDGVGNSSLSRVVISRPIDVCLASASRRSRACIGPFR